MKTIINTAMDKENDLEIITMKIIQQLGIPVNLKRYRYLRCALILCTENIEMTASAIKYLYKKFT